MKASLQKMLPNTITFIGLIGAISAIILTLEGQVVGAAACILAGYLLDAVDGTLARRFGVTSDFGLQLDSLADTVTFGVAPSALAYQHLARSSLNPALAWGACVAFAVGGVFRLARFNLLPTKESGNESIGLTISTSGATLTLAILADHVHEAIRVPAAALLALMALLTFLMASRIRYPALSTVFGRRGWSPALLGVVVGFAIAASFPVAGLGLSGGYAAFGLIRAIRRAVRH